MEKLKFHTECIMTDLRKSTAINLVAFATLARVKPIERYKIYWRLVHSVDDLVKSGYSADAAAKFMTPPGNYAIITIGSLECVIRIDRDVAFYAAFYKQAKTTGTSPVLYTLVLRSHDSLIYACRAEIRYGNGVLNLGLSAFSGTSSFAMHVDELKVFCHIAKYHNPQQ
jgi:hypothetical protein